MPAQSEIASELVSSPPSQLAALLQNAGISRLDQTGWIRVAEVNAKWSIATIVQEYSPRAPMRPNDFIQLHDGKEPKGLGDTPKIPS